MFQADLTIKKEKKTKKSKKSEEVNNNSDNVENKVAENVVVEEKSIKLDNDENIQIEENLDVENIETSEDVEETSSEELINNYMNCCKILEDLSKLNLKNYSFTKNQVTPLTKCFTKINKYNGTIQNNYIEFLSKEASESFKTKDAKSKKVKKPVDKKNSAVHKLKPTYPEVLDFMRLDKDTLISQTDIQKAICNYVKNLKIDNNPDIVFKGDNKRFNIVADLKDLFTFLNKIKKERGKDEEIPKDISYTELMSYFKYCFPEK